MEDGNDGCDVESDEDRHKDKNDYEIRREW